MSRDGVVIGIDLGTGSAPVCYCRFGDSSFNCAGKVHRKCGNVIEVRNWPGSDVGVNNGNPCLPTDLIYSKTSRELLYWGFEAQQYLDEYSPEIPFEEVFVVENIKLLIPDPDQAKSPSAATERYRLMRKTLVTTLGKEPEDVFEDFLSQLINHLVGSLKAQYGNHMHGFQIELVLAFPSGWEDQVHTTVSRIGTSAVKKAISEHALENITFDMENVYTVSETLCGVKEWLRETIAEQSLITSFDPQPTNLDGLNEGDCFLPIDLGAGTGCLTPLRLITKRPLAVAQLDRTQSLEVSGEAVEAEFERWIQQRITKEDYPGDIALLVRQICRKFKIEEKKKCGLRSSIWSFYVNGLRANPRKLFEENCMRLERKYLDMCFDPVIDTLEQEIMKILARFPSIKAIVFLGQFGGNSPYLKKRMAESHFAKIVNIKHSQRSKFDVVKGAISERMTLDESFVRKYKTLKSYGTLVTLDPNIDVEMIFPNLHKHGAIFESSEEGSRLKVIEWAIPKETMIENGRRRDIGRDGQRYHTWPSDEKDIGFEDTIIVSDENVPDPQLNGFSYTLWTAAHERNKLWIEGQRIQVQKIPFGWDLSMSRKLDSEGNILGPYHEDDLAEYVYQPRKTNRRRRNLLYPRKKTKKPQGDRFRVLYYNLIWDITEMQVKVHVQAKFPNQDGPSIPQLAKERVLSPDEKMATGESRSKALVNDIKIELTGRLESEDEDESTSEDWIPRSINEIYAPDERHLEDSLRNQYSILSGGEYSQMAAQQNEQRNVRHNPQPTLQDEQQRDFQVVSNFEPEMVWDTVYVEAESPTTLRNNRRRHNGCFTCKDRKKKCDCLFVFDDTSGSNKCRTCIKHAIPCYMNQPIECVVDPQQEPAQQLERKIPMESGKRKSREESDSSESISSGRSTTLLPQEPFLSHTATYSLIEEQAEDQSESSHIIEHSPESVRRGKYTAIRGGKNSFKPSRHRASKTREPSGIQ